VILNLVPRQLFLLSKDILFWAICAIS